MRQRCLELLALMSTLALGCGGGSDPGSPNATDLTIEPGDVVLDLGVEQTLSVVATFDDGHTADVAASASLSVSGAAAKIEGARVVPTASGDAELTATFGSKTAHAKIHVRGWSTPTALTPAGAHPNFGGIVALDTGRALFFRGFSDGHATTRLFDGDWSAEAPLPVDDTVYTTPTGNGKLLLVTQKDPMVADASSYVFDPAAGVGPAQPLTTTSKGGTVALEFADLAMSPDGSHGAELVDLTTTLIDDSGVGIVRWTEAAGWGAVEVLDPSTHAEAWTLKVENNGRVTAIYASTTGATKEVRVAVAEEGSGAHAPTTVLTVHQHQELAAWGIELNEKGDGIVAVGVEGSANSKEVSLFDVHDGVVSTSASVLPKPANGYASWPVAPNGYGSWPDLAVLPNGDALIATTTGSPYGLTIQRYSPGKGVVETTSAWPKNTQVRTISAMNDGSAWLIAGTMEGSTSDSPAAWFAQHRTADGVWQAAVHFPGKHYGDLYCSTTPAGTLALELGQDGPGGYTPVATVYR